MLLSRFQVLILADILDPLILEAALAAKKQPLRPECDIVFFSKTASVLEAVKRLRNAGISKVS
jgi:hypothetical protein